MSIQTDIARSSTRKFLSSHPWLTFELRRSDQLPAMFWEQLGEARSMSLQLARTPLPPQTTLELRSLYLATAVHANAAIEGNSLSEAQALDAVSGRLEVPRSRRYLGRELENILGICSAIEARAYGENGRAEITPGLLRDLNRRVLAGLDVAGHVEPGELRSDVVGDGDDDRRGAPARDCAFLVELLCDWLNGPDFESGEDARQNFFRAVLRAVMAHMYIAWIGPFGEGNGQVARLVELDILASTGVPFAVAHLLSNHYNQTRTAYYRQLRHAGQSGGDVRVFLVYAIEGFVDGLQLQLRQVHEHVFEIAWASYVDGMFGAASTPARRRQREVVLALPVGAEDSWAPRASIPAISPRVAELYRGRGPKTVSRDIKALGDLGLIERRRGSIRPKAEVMLGLGPPTASAAVVSPLEPFS